MKKTIKTACSILFVLCFLISVTACGKENTDAYLGKEVVPLSSQLDALVQLDASSVDVAVIDSVMANFYVKSDTYADKLTLVDGLVFTEETYAVAGRKGDRALMSKINEALIGMADGDYQTVAKKYNLTSELLVTASTANPLADAADDSWNAVVSDGKLIVGYTVYAPIAYTENGVFMGFDTDLAKAAVSYLNGKYGTDIEVEFQLIEWDSKETLLAEGTIDLIWNGLTYTDERAEAMCLSVSYMRNNQVAVIRKADASVYTDKASMKTAIIGVEGGSAGEDVARGK